ncbi:MAG: FAD-binding oxidoreductase [Pseudomonadota bacterium]
MTQSHPVMSQGAAPISLWDVTSTEDPMQGDFTPSEQTVDLAIVGAGFTGLSTALHAAAAGQSVHVLEAQSIGFGGSGRNVGLVNAGVWHPPAKVRTALGETYGSRFLKTFGDGPKMVFDLIEKYQIRCEATKTGTIHAAHAPSGFVDLKERHAEWQRMGEPVELLTRQEVSERTGSRAFFGGLLDHRAGTINPMGYVRGLARAAVAAGASISTGVKVTGLKRSDGIWRVATDKGEVLARSVVLGTNAYTDALWPGLSKVFTPIHYFQFATAPLGPDAAHILPDRQGVWDTAPIMTSVRRDAMDRLIVGSMGTVLGEKSHGLSKRWAQKQIKRLFPELGQVTFEEAWHGRIAMTPDHLPRICILHEGLYSAIGYNGRGITTGTIFGQAMAGLTRGDDPNGLPVPVSKIEEVKSAPVMSRLYQLAFSVNQIIKSV